MRPEGQGLRELIEQERERFGVAGLAVVVVRDGEVVLADGFGSRDLAADLPVTDQTLFAIASDTKAFTAALCATLVDEGQLTWDAPVREVLPWFRLKDPQASELVSVRDLLAHRTGLPRHDALDFRGGPKLELAEVTRRLRYLEPSAQLRSLWQYNNLCFAAAGYLAGELDGRGYHQAVRHRLLAPLGMTRSCFGPAAAEAAGDFAVPYDDRSGSNEPVQRIGEGSVGPPGGLWSSAAEMAQWVLARLGQPLADGRLLLSEDARRQLHTPAMVTPAGPADLPERVSLGYGLAADVYSYRGQRMVRHGGNLHGFSSDVVLLPEQGHAVVVLSNANGSAVRDGLPLVLLDRLLGLELIPWGSRLLETWQAIRAGIRAAAAAPAAATTSGTARPAPPARPLAHYAGRYRHPAYETFEFSVVDGLLTVAWHDLSGLRLRHVEYDTFELNLGGHYTDLPMPLVFQAAEGGVGAVTVALEPAVSPVVFERESHQLAEAELAGLLGAYRMGPLRLRLRAGQEPGSVAVELPGRPPAQLYAWDDSRFYLVSSPGIRVAVDRDDAGRANRVVVRPMGVFDRTEENE